jgi:RNA polymerase sigma-70 factor (ECF subfamily)
MNKLDEEAPEQREHRHATTEFHVGRVRSGDRSSFARLYERLAPSLETWARLRVTGTLRQYVEPGDVVQEVWWRAMDAFERYDPARSSFRAWIFKIATNVLLEWNRKRRRRARIEPANLAQRVSSLPPELARQATSVGRGIAERDSVRKLVEVVSAMSAEDRSVFLHCGLEGRTIAEAAPLVGANVEAVGKRWQRLREKLQAHAVWTEFDPSEG